MTDSSQTPVQTPQANTPGSVQVDKKFFASVNEYVTLSNRLAREQGLEHASAAALFATARFNAHVFLATSPADGVAEARTRFLDHMTALYRRMLNQHLDGQGKERGIDVGVSELTSDDAAGTPGDAA